jgi:Methylmalonyl-CoA mutase, C-terminal domain/subun it (cobalamin-binding)
MTQAPKVYKPKNHIRIVTAASLFDGHDAAINVMRRIIQSSGAEVIHLGHNRSVHEIVNTAIQEDAQAIAITSYQGGHMEFFKYMYDMLEDKGCGHIKIFGGGGGVILPEEVKELMNYGITRIYSPDDGMEMGLQGMINDLMEKSDFPTGESLKIDLNNILKCNYVSIGRLISAAENYPEIAAPMIKELINKSKAKKAPVLGITGTGGAGKSSLVDEIVRRFLDTFPNKSIAIISVDPSKRKSGGALLGDRIRMNAIDDERVYMRSLATRQSNLSISNYVKDAEIICSGRRF